MVYTRNYFLETASEFMDEIEKPVLLINFDSEIPKEVYEGTQICFSHTKHGNYDFMISINHSNEGIYIDRIHKYSRKFEYEDITKNHFEYLISCLAIGFENHQRTRECSFMDANQIGVISSKEIEMLWEENHLKNHLKSYVGVDLTGNSIILDLHEKGSGPHGLISGMTGSGKSEFLVSMLLSLCLQYSPEDLQIAIIDFKGGGCAESFKVKGEYIQHIVNVLDNLDSSSTDRALVSFRNECNRREKLLKKLSEITHANINTIDTYRKTWSSQYNIPFLSHLVIVVDEFAELKSENPEFITDLISIARVGRSLGIHLLLSTQKPAGVINDQIWSNMRFKICLKVQESQDSREVLHDDKAARLKNPGEFYLLCDNVLTYGIGSYANQKFQNVQGYFSLFENGFYQEYLQKKDFGITQREMILEEIMRISKKYKIHKLWNSQFEEIQWNLLKPGQIGIADNYWNNSLIPIQLENNIALFSVSYDMLQHTLLCFLYAMMRRSENCEVYAIVREESSIRLLQNEGIVSGVILEDDVFRMKLMKKHVFKKVNKDVRKIILIEDIGSFQDVEQSSIFRELMKYGETYQISLIVGCVDTADFKYRDLLKFRQRVVVTTNNISDASAILDSKALSLPKDNHVMMNIDKHTMDVCIPKTDMNMFHDLHFHSSYILPDIPDVCTYQECDGELYKIGISYQTYEWVTLSKNELLIVFSNKVRNSEWFCELFHTKGIPIMNHFDESKNHGMLHLPIDEYVMLKNELVTRHPVLFIGQGFQQQYYLKHVIHEELKDDEGILFIDDQWEKIKLVSEK